MRQLTLALLFCLFNTLAIAQKKTAAVPALTTDHWTFATQKVTFLQEDGRPVMKLSADAGPVTTKDFVFTNGTIEFDVKPNSLTFYFRYRDANENECFYFRMNQAGNPTAVDAVQYAPYVKGVLLWNTYPQYQTNASFTKDAWNHVKLVVSGTQMRLYVNGTTTPTLAVGRLEANTTDGRIGFEGDMSVANLIVKPNQVDGLLPELDIDPVQYDPRYIRSWAVSEPFVAPKNVDFGDDFMLTPETKWQVLATERLGLLNLTRTFGKSTDRRFVWLKLKIKSDVVRKRKLNLGFVDDVWVYVNGQLAYVDKNRYGRPIAKEPDGRCSIENTSFMVPLRAGHNELLIGLANDFYGWGTIARIDDVAGLEIAPDPTFDYRLVKIPAQGLDVYAGTYLRPDGKKIFIERENNRLKLSGENFFSSFLYPKAENQFFAREYDFTMDFPKDASGKPSRFLILNNGKQLLEAKRLN